MDEFVSSFFKLFVMMDIMGALPMFLLLSEKLSKNERSKAVNEVLVVAVLLLILFVFAGVQVLDYFGVSLGGFQVAGGLILFTLGIRIVLGLPIEAQKKHVERYEFAAVPIAMPLIIGPGTITMVIILVGEYGYAPVLVAGVLDLILLWVLFRNAFRVYKFVGHQGVEVISRLMGIIFTALSVEFIKEGLGKLLA